VLVGVLIWRSRLIPRVIGAMMIVASVCYLVNSVALILSPALSNLRVPWILLPCFLGELSLALWLVVKGVKVEAPRLPLYLPKSIFQPSYELPSLLFTLVRGRYSIASLSSSVRNHPSEARRRERDDCPRWDC
jgi:hypothetical protein